MRRLVAAPLLTLSITCLSACATANSTKPQPATRTDPRTAQALLQIARQFNNAYAARRDGAVYDRWDAQSRAIITRAQYIRRHQECPTAPGHATVQNAVRAGAWWLVHYSISGTELTDYWHYQHGRWTFDLTRSNPQAVRLYRLPAAQYLTAIGCTTHH